MNTILIVEDDPDTLETDCGVIGRYYPVLSATNGDDALRMARTAAPSVIVLDVVLAEGQDGFSVFRELAAHPSTRGIPVIFLTGINRLADLPVGGDDIAAYLGRRPSAFLEKPVDPERLIAAIEAAIASRV